jgi:hypothetical protein
MEAYTESETKERLLNLINHYNRNFSSSELDNLITKGSISYFYSVTGAEPQTVLEESDSRQMELYFNKLRK